RLASLPACGRPERTYPHDVAESAWRSDLGRVCLSRVISIQLARVRGVWPTPFCHFTSPVFERLHVDSVMYRRNLVLSSWPEPVNDAIPRDRDDFAVAKNGLPAECDSVHGDTAIAI